MIPAELLKILLWSIENVIGVHYSLNIYSSAIAGGSVFASDAV